MAEIHSDEIDLIEVARSIVTFFKKHFYKLVIAGFAGGLAGFFYTFQLSPEYKSNMVGVSTILNMEDVTPIIRKFQSLLEDNNYEELAKMIPLDSNDLSKIKSIAVTSTIIPKKDKKDEVYTTNKFNIEIVTFENKLFTKLNLIVPELIRSNEYTKLRSKLITENNQNMYKRLDKEIKLLDSLKMQVLPGLTANNKAIFYTTNPSSINETILRLYEQQLAINETLQLRQDFLVIESFAQLKTPVNKKYIKNILMTSILFLSVILVYCAFREVYLYVIKSV